MAYNSQSTRGLVRFGRQLVGQIRTITSPLSMRSVHVSVYDKNPEENEQENVNQRSDEANQDKNYYWAPHPKTGVFGPLSEENNNASTYAKATATSTTTIADSMFEHKAFVRPLEDMEKQPLQP